MKKLVMLGCLAAVGCGGDTPTGPTTTNTVFTVALSAANEAPPVSNAEAGATGTATITFHVTRDTAGTVTGATVDFAVTMANFPAGSTARMAHIHTAAAGVAGPILIDTGLSPSAPVVMPSGTGSFSLTGVQAKVDAANAVLANPAGHYFNVHSVLNGPGAIRGQLR